ncbi:phosphotransferase family protein [Novosphingobium kaempferiae]|uniref:phosphotransferase family protein n=1 Tax=Novosphingobium kaempferiae TaxID=2896849 RepID=UPI001E4D133E|nr:phosphotransferase family protein [Novosphingobium kaempferiae]
MMDADLDRLAPIGPLTEWLDAHVPQLGKGPLKTAVLSGGTSNVVLTLDRGDRPMVMRRPPAVPPPGAEKGVLREARILTALNATDVPHPVCHGSCADDGVVGAPFYVMDKVEGWAPNLRDERIHNEPPFDRMPYEYGIPFAIVDGLIALANVDHEAIGLDDYGKPGPFLQRQVDRWAGQLASYKERYGYEGRELPGYAETEEWLRANVLPNERRGIIHGDVGTPNMMFRHGPPARLAAMIDWELSTIGDPMIDMGWFTGGMRDEDEPDKTFPTALNNPAHFPTRQELGRYYCAGTGRDIRDFDYFSILAKFKSGCLLEYKVAQAEAGILPKETGRFFAKIVLNCFEDTAKMVRRIA